MKKFLSIIIFISIALSSYSQAVVIDATRQASDTAIGSEEQAEEEVQKTALEKIQEFSKKTQNIMDSVNVYMNMATDYVRTAKQLKQAIELLSKTVSNYDNYVDYIKNSTILSIDDKLQLISQMTYKIKNIKELVDNIKDVSGANSKGLSEKEKAAKEGKMKDGERLRLMTKYLSCIIMEVTDIHNIYINAINKENGLSFNKMLEESSMNAMFFNYN
jgi:hypothetical protein